MRAIPFIILALLGPLPVIAQELVPQDITVRAGRHPSFTRLTFPLPADATWQLGRDGASSYLLRINGVAVSFDTQQVYQRIGTERIAALAPDGSDFGLTLGCACYADAFIAAPNLLAVDIRDGVPPPTARFEAALDPILPLPDIARPLPLVFLPSTAAAPVVDLGPFERALQESFARAAAQGLVDATVPVMRPAPALPDPIEAPLVAAPSIRAQPGIAVQTSIDRDSGPPARDRLSRSGAECLPDAAFSLAAWGAGVTLQDAVSTGFSTLYTANEAVTRDGVATLAQSYLHFGFGREASAIAAVYPLADPGLARLAALGRIIDEVPVATPAFGDQHGCLGAVALWAALEAGQLPPLRPEDRIAMTTALRDLPEPLRGQMGLRLARLTLDAGDIEGAQAIMDIGSTARAYGAEGVTSLIADSMAGASAAVSVLQQAQQSGAVVDPASLIALTDAVLQRGEAPPTALFDMVSSARYSLRGTAFAADLARAQMQLLLADGQVAQAKAFLAQPDLGLSPPQAATMGDLLLLAQTDRLSDFAFLGEVLALDPNTIGAIAGNSAAKRLINLGFGEQALALLTPPATGEAMAERRYLRAEAAQMTGRTAVGLAALTGLTDPRAEVLRQALQDPAHAADNATDQAWRRGDWAALANTGDAVLQAVATEITQGPTPADSIATLAQAQAVITQSQAARDMASGLLDRFALPR
ncbi:conserved hypothetical protein [Ketogulonicigenium vulgare Y25]|uniref:hypothetical protein n=2 Tax=Ketogulonicigenium vulgare TaxID=92945 RepID=UPI0001E6826D|nr:hypothetical protein [Ketogulonicigenium vulgare]ADO43504.1 conserved hypothetical protein [Ketogulonicigenium vulgare Y25]ALJ81889.1 hypothetical protein KVH_12380 [Ketogulonicigenium vulgare]AOZ55539.1 hypothetical protein KVC_2537 [Ketogulonicigenium vulgare]